MSQFEKSKERILRCPSDYTYDELISLLEHFGYELDNKGKTSGSRVVFFHPTDGRIIQLHKPHPQPTLKAYAIKQIVDKLKEYGDLE